MAASSSTPATQPGSTGASPTTASSTEPTSTTGASAAPTTPSSGATGTPAHRHKKPAGGSINVRVPATFAIRSGRRLEPQTVSAPAFLAVRVTVSSADGGAHRVVVRTPTQHTLTVPAGGRASVLIPGLRAGQYRIDVDGSTRGALLIGGEPGP